MDRVKIQKVAAEKTNWRGWPNFWTLYADYRTLSWQSIFDLKLSVTWSLILFHLVNLHLQMLLGFFFVWMSSHWPSHSSASVIKRFSKAVCRIVGQVNLMILDIYIVMTWRRPFVGNIIIFYFIKLKVTNLINKVRKLSHQNISGFRTGLKIPK